MSIDQGRNTVDDLVVRLRAIPYTGAISDILDEGGFRQQVLPWQIQAVERGSSIVGRALTVEGKQTTDGERDDFFIPFLRMLGEVGPGDVIVSQPNDHVCAHFGELSAETAQHRGGMGAVIDGGVRDVEYISKLAFPIFARYTTPLDIIGRWQLTAFNEPITIGVTRVEAGDYIVGDHDGVVVIPKGIAADVVAKAEEVVKTENVLRKEILEGAHPVDAYMRHGRF
jgi:regulator of RNase E activity RraA